MDREILQLQTFIAFMLYRSIEICEKKEAQRWLDLLLEFDSGDRISSNINKECWIKQCTDREISPDHAAILRLPGFSAN